MRRFSDFDLIGAPSPDWIADGRSGFPHDPDYEAQPGIRDVLAAARGREPVLFVSGRAGTGKSRLINYLRRDNQALNQVVVAPTGIAALSLQASTIHSLFRLPVGVINIASLALEPPVDVLKGISRLIIDEIGMVRADILDAIDLRLRQAKRNERPFGGVQVIMVGDFLQLSPIVSDDDQFLLDKLGYASPFAFSARVLSRVKARTISLTKVWRQGDALFTEVLAAIRLGRNTADALEWLNMRCVREHRAGTQPLLLTSTRLVADAHNSDGIAAILADPSMRPFTFRAVASGGFADRGDAVPAPRELKLCRGARVMSVRNDPDGGFVNGSLGVVEEVGGWPGTLDGSFVVVRFDGQEKSVVITPVDWHKMRQSWDGPGRRITQAAAGSYRQIPLAYGYAMTIHRSQGLSLDDVRIDLGRGAFAPGQLYVGLSRARSVEGLSLARRLRPDDLRVNEKLLRFLRWAEDETED